MLHRFYSYLLKNQVILALFLIAAGWLLLQTRGIITSIFIAYIINAALLPVVKYLRNKKVPHFFAVLIPYIGIAIVVFLIIFPLVPFLIDQVKALLGGLPSYIKQAADVSGLTVDATQIQSYVTREVNSIGSNAFSVTSKVFGGLFSTLTVLVVSFYLILYHERFKENIAHLFHKNDRERVLSTLSLIDEKLGAWLTGQVLLSLFIGVITWAALSIIGFPYALPLGILAGILEIVPTIGPILSAIPAIVVALTVSPPLAIIIALIYFGIQMIENNVLVPKIMQRAVGLNPVLVIVAVMIGANLLGVLGALLAVPFVSFLIVLFNGLSEE
ncbi:MAG: AI-2E family transporter [Candidatus Levybacteria bacterium]|nr:AI-2E family transporter [Candidatus Levybacteria bacterium]